MTRPIIVWFRQDLRIADNPALAAAYESGAPVLPLYILDDETPGEWQPGGASRWWLHHSLASLSASLGKLGVPLILRRGKAEEVLDQLIGETDATGVYWNRCYEPFAITRDKAIKATLQEIDIEAKSFNASLLVEPWEVRSKSGTPFKVFTPFWKTVRSQLTFDLPLPAPTILTPSENIPFSDQLDDWLLTPTSPDWAAGFGAQWTPGEAGAVNQFVAFLDAGIAGYAQGRDRPDRENVSRLSPHLHWGEISPRQIVAALDERHGTDKDREKFIAELGWREFSYHLLYQAPDLPHKNFRAEFDTFPWARDQDLLSRWQRGETGYPIVDAGMRQLWHTGWMHNRVRMIVASFLVKHLLQPWQDGAAWFWDTLVDADLASNSASWQWVAGCGADAAPYFRVFNPVLQGKKFDPDGLYVKKWVPELADVPAVSVHAPLEMAVPPAGYPAPIIELSVGRNRALAAYETMKVEAEV